MMLVFKEKMILIMIKVTAVKKAPVQASFHDHADDYLDDDFEDDDYAVFDAIHLFHRAVCKESVKGSKFFEVVRQWKPIVLRLEF